LIYCHILACINSHRGESTWKLPIFSVKNAARLIQPIGQAQKTASPAGSLCLQRQHNQSFIPLLVLLSQVLYSTCAISQSVRWVRAALEPSTRQKTPNLVTGWSLSRKSICKASNRRK